MKVINVILSYVSAFILYLLNSQNFCVILSNNLYSSIQSIFLKIQKLFTVKWWHFLYLKVHLHILKLSWIPLMEIINHNFLPWKNWQLNLNVDIPAIVLWWTFRTANIDECPLIVMQFTKLYWMSNQSK